MKNTLQKFLTPFAFAFAAFLASCSDKDPIIADEPVKPSEGMYVLNEGRFMVDKSSSISYIDFETKEVTKNIFQANNSTADLGSDPNDMGQYGSLLFVSVTSSNKVLVLDAATAKQIKAINIEQPRFMAFHDGKVFVTSYTNKVFAIDTLTNAVSGEVAVGRTPEQIAVANNKVYVANSGSNDFITGGSHDNRVFVIDPSQLTVQKEIEVADNVYQLYADGKGSVYAGTADIYTSVGSEWVLQQPAKLYRINTSTDAIDKEFDFGVQRMDFSDNKAYMISTNYSDTYEYTLLEMDLNGENLSELDYFKSITIDNMYALTVDQKNGDIWISNTDYETDGKVYHYVQETQQVEEFSVGFNPAALVLKK